MDERLCVLRWHYQSEVASVWIFATKVIKYTLGFILCLIGLVVAFNGQVIVSKNSGPAHPDKLLQYVIGGAFFLVGIFFVASAKRSKRRSRGMGVLPPSSNSYPPAGPLPPTRDQVDRDIARQMAEDSQRQLDQLQREADQRRIWGN